MVEGTVKFFDETKHFGFINGDDGKSYFVHESALKEGVSIAEGDRVTFDAVAGDKGPKAENVVKSEGKTAEAAKEEAPAETEEAAAEESEENSE
jgi:CspA family cold shock protein